MSFEITIFLEIAVLLLTAKIFGEIAERFNLSHIVGEVIAGILLGALHLVSQTEFLSQLSSIGIILLFFLIGIEVSSVGSKQNGGTAILSSMLSFLLGFAVGFVIFGALQAFVLGIALMTTSTLASLHSYISVGQIKTRAHDLVVELNSYEVLFGVIVLTALASGISSGFSYVFITVITAVAVLITILIMKFSDVTSRFTELIDNKGDAELLTAAVIVLIFIVSFAADNVGIAFFGAFVAGLLLNKSPSKDSYIIPNIKTIGFGFFIPLFFAYSALSFSLSALLQYWWVVLVLFLLVAVSKLFGLWLPAKLLKQNQRDAIMAGLGMMPRGEYSILAVHIALASAIILPSVYTIVVGVCLLSMVITPVILHILKTRI